MQDPITAGSDWRSRIPGPEGVAGTLVALIAIALVIGTAVPATVVDKGPGSSADASSSRSAGSAPAVTPIVDVANVALAEGLGSRLAADRVALALAIADKRTFDATRTLEALRQVNADLVALIVPADRLYRNQATAESGGRLLGFCNDLRNTILPVLVTSPVPTQQLYLDTSTTVVARLATLPPLLEGLRQEAHLPSVTPTGSSMPPSTAPSSTPSPTLAPTATATPSGGSGASPAPRLGPNMLVDSGFESGVGYPWTLTLGSGAAAVIVADTAVHASGTTSARVDIGTATEERAGVAVLQANLSLTAGRNYEISAWIQARSSREVRLRLVSATGQTYGAQVFVVGPRFAQAVMDVAPLIDDPSAVLEFDLGRSNVTTWIDDVVVAEVAPTP